MTHRRRSLFGAIDPQLTRSQPEIPPPRDPSSQWIHLNDSDSDLSQDLASPVIRTQIRDNPAVRPGPNVVRSLSFELPRAPPVPPTQAILDSSPDSKPSSPDLFEEADLARGIEERDSPIIETLSSEGGAGGWATPKKDHEPDPCPAPNTSTKKRKKKFGLAAKLDLVWRENQTDRLLKTHIRGNSSTSTCAQSTSDTDLCLFIDHVTNYRAFKNLTCHCSIQSDKIYQVTIQPADLPQIPLECLVSGTEIRIPAPFYSSSRLSENNSVQVIFGIQRLEILDQTVIKSTPESTLFTWHCTCIDPDPIQIDQEFEFRMSREREPENPEDDITIPRAAMNKMIKELCPNTRVANDARELILNCSTEFIHLLSSESNEMCNNQLKKTISAEHVLMALDSLGFSDFKKDCEEVLTECKDVAAKRRRQSTRLENLGIPEEELLRQQQELFARARAAAAEQDMQMQMKNQNNPDNPTNHLAMPGNQAPSTSSIQPPLQPQTPSRLNSTQSNNDDDDEDYS